MMCEAKLDGVFGVPQIFLKKDGSTILLLIEKGMDDS